MKRLILIIILFNVITIANAQQIRQFTADTTIYINEIRKFTANYISSTETETLERFISLWQNGGFTWDEMSAIANNSTMLVRKNGRASPHFIQYFDLLTIFYAPDFIDPGKAQWQKALTHFLSDRDIGLKTLDEFMKSTAILLKKSELFSIIGNVWKADNPSYRFDFNNGVFTVAFNPFTLTCLSKRDSIKVFNTSGILDPINNIYYGHKGVVTMERAGMQADEAFINLGNFKIDLRKSEYTADSVQLYYKKYFHTPLLGRFEDKVMQITSPERATFPKFYSYQNKYILPEIFRDIEYIGGLSMQGARLIGTGTAYEPAILNIKDKGLHRLRIEAQQILFSAKTVNSPSVKLTLYMENDSLFHPDLQFSYNENSDEIRCTKSRTYTSASPYTNSYHNMDMNFEEFYWKRDERIIRFRPLTGTSIGIATFESNTFFNYRVFEDLQSMDRINPLVGLWQYGRMVNLESFPLTNYARYLGMDPSQVRQQLMQLSRMGFVFLNDEEDMISLRPKLFYFLDASVGKVDYDVILFSSRTQAPLENALLNLDDLDLTINGIQHISISDSQNVVLIPNENQIVMKRNKSFQFNGVVYAGLFSFFGNNFFFEYDKFKVNMQDIDSVGMAVSSKKVDNVGRIVAEKINNLLEDATGELLIDEPMNKSGLNSFPQYPTFISHEHSYVYYDEMSIQNGAYSRKDVFFRVEPFSMDSLDNFTRDGLMLAGQFYSGEILPPIDQTLVLMPDNSLGFRHSLPESGLPVYGGSGTFFQEIELSNLGIRGSGKLDYLTSSTWSDNFIFHPDSLMTISRDFTIEKQYAEVEYPSVKSKNNTIKWFTKPNKFTAATQDVPFTIFADTINMLGDIILQPNGLSGNGSVDMVTASLASNNLRYKADQILSDTSTFQLKSPALNKLALSTTDLNARIDFKSREGEFTPNSGHTQVEFPENRFISKLNYFRWMMADEQLSMGQDKPVESYPTWDGLSGPRYTSIHPKQDSLSFVSPVAIYDYKNFIIKATKVPYIQVADARIYPSDGLIVVQPNANIKQLTEAIIITDFTNEYFKLYDAAVSINGKYDYSASAKYEYIDYADRGQVIQFSSVRVDSSGQTIAGAELTSRDSFMLSPHFDYQGKIGLASGSRLLTFDGAARTIHSCTMGKSWIKFKAEIDPMNVMIPIAETPLDINLNRIYAGIMLTRDSSHVYSTFGSARKDYFDSYIATASGYLTYDIQNNYYEIANLDKLSNKENTGNYLRLNTYPCQVYSEGKIDYGLDFGQLKADAIGTSLHDLEQDNFSSDAFLAFDFFFSQEALQIFSTHLDSIPGLNPYDLTNPLYNLALKELVGSQSAATMSGELGLYGSYRSIPDAFKKSLILSGVNFTWNMNTRSFRYTGDVGVIRVGDKQINKQVKAYIELSKRSSGDLLDIYFMLDERTYYYFGYNPGSLQVISSNRSFNNIIFDLKENQRKLAVRPGQTGFIFSLAPERRAQLFLRRYMDEEDGGNN